MPNEELLDADLATVDTSFPVIKKGLYDLKIVETEVKENESKTLMLTYEPLEPTVSDKGENLEAGTRVFDNINLAVTGKAKVSFIKQNVAAFVQALEAPAGWTIRRLMTSNPELKGCIIKARVNIQPAGPDSKGVFRKA